MRKHIVSAVFLLNELGRPTIRNNITARWLGQQCVCCMAGMRCVSPSRLGNDFGVSERSVRRWRGEPERWPVPERIWSELRTLCLDRAEAILDLVGKIDGL